MKELYPLSALTPKQSVIASELLRDYPGGRVENHDGKPVFVTDGKTGAVSVQLSPSQTGSRPPISRNPFR
jgi:hypothetical protein